MNRVKNDENSLVTLSIDSSRIGGEIQFTASDNSLHRISISHVSDYIDPKVNRFSNIHILRHLEAFLNDSGVEIESKGTSKYIRSVTSNNQQLGSTIAKSIKSIESVCATTNPHYAKVRLYGDYYYYTEFGYDTQRLLDRFNTVAGWWASTGEDNANMELIVKSVDIWTSADESEGCYEAETMKELAFNFSEWGNAKGILGDWIEVDEDTEYWTGDTDLCILFTGHNIEDTGYGIRKTAGVKHSSYHKFGAVELYPFIFQDQVRCTLSHEMGHMFSGHHQDYSEYGHKAWTWVDIFLRRYTNIWNPYHFGQTWGGRFSCEGVNGAGPDNNNVYYIREWRDDYLRTEVFESDNFNSGIEDFWNEVYPTGSGHWSWEDYAGHAVPVLRSGSTNYDYTYLEQMLPIPVAIPFDVSVDIYKYATSTATQPQLRLYDSDSNLIAYVGIYDPWASSNYKERARVYDDNGNYMEYLSGYKSSSPWSKEVRIWRDDNDYIRVSIGGLVRASRYNSKPLQSIQLYIYDKWAGSYDTWLRNDLTKQWFDNFLFSYTGEY